VTRHVAPLDLTGRKKYSLREGGQYVSDNTRIDEDWRTKPTDRFILKLIKIHLSARISPHLVDRTGLRPWMITLGSAGLGVTAGVIFALGMGWLAGCFAALSQILDGVDGQFARLTGQQTRGGAFWDSVLDRYSDGAMMIGLTLYLTQVPSPVPLWGLLVLGTLALIGCNLISYSTARAENLDLDFDNSTLAGKGTRMTVMILTAWGSLLWPTLPLAALLYLAIHPNLVVLDRLKRASRTI